MYRSPSPFAPDNNQYHPQPFVPPGGGQINPGSVTYTTSTGADGRVVYHPFKCVLFFADTDIDRQLIIDSEL